MGGETHLPGFVDAGDGGSSPRGRGKPEHQGHDWQAAGLIPAWAGKTRLGTAFVSSAAAHPRVGGENTSLRISDASVPGSSPRGRGKLSVDHVLAVAEGLIPAWAGKTSALAGFGFAHRAHPRVGGENIITNEGQARTAGSSPRGRGKLLTLNLILLGRGLIPAWAGKTSIGRPRPPRLPAHPRVGGENRVQAQPPHVI